MSVERAFLDTNIVVYALERPVSPRNLAACELVASLVDNDRVCVSTQVLQELYVTLTRKSKQLSTASEAAKHLADLSQWPLFVIDYAAIRESAQLSESARISFWDALIVVSAARSGAKTLYTEDLNDGQRIMGVEIRNPFREIKS